jgi:hypothetical protein
VYTTNLSWGVFLLLLNSITIDQEWDLLLRRIKCHSSTDKCLRRRQALPLLRTAIIPTWRLAVDLRPHRRNRRNHPELEWGLDHHHHRRNNVPVLRQS